MSTTETGVKYNSVKIPDRQQVNQISVDTMLQKNNATASVSVDNNLFYEIDYDSYPIKGAGRFVLKSQKIEPQEKDEIREQFYAMREISRNHRSNYGYSNKFYDKRVQQNNASVFYKQGTFMKDFMDNYSENAPFSSYFPNYQMMSYDQLRTYFTWRTNVRDGNITDISLSYAFLYIYELLNNIGVGNPHDGLKKLMYFWRTFRNYNKSIDKYVIQWLKDYHIYYELPHSFKDFAEENNLSKHYPKMAEMADTDDRFDLFCSISKYDIRKSAFFEGNNIKLITDCFNFVIERIKEVFSENGLHFENSIFAPTKKMTEWQPFRSALFCGWLKQPDRRIVLSQNEIYVCKQNKWEFNTVITSESGKQLVGYVMKKVEAELRNLKKYKFKITANINTVTQSVIAQLKESGLSLENIITSAVMEFYKEATKIVVSIDYSSLVKIRQEALSTQEKLSVEQVEDEAFPVLKGVAAPDAESMSSSAVEGVVAPALEDMAAPDIKDETTPVIKDVVVPVFDRGAVLTIEDTVIPVLKDKAVPISHETDKKSIINKPELVSDPWENFNNSICDTEKQALIILLSDKQDIKQFADDNGIMLEVLIDGINEKAIDFIGDNILDENFNVYDDYMEKVKKMVDEYE